MCSLAGVVFLLLGAMALVPLKLVTVKMLPFDNKSEFQVMVDMPEGHAARDDGAGGIAHGRRRARRPGRPQRAGLHGTSSPYNFNGLVRHYFLRQAAHLADLQVNLLPKHDRSEQSHDIARRVRERLLPVAQADGATIQVAEVPPGPPVLQTLVAEVYGPDVGASRGGAAGQGHLRADGRRGRRRLVRRGSAAQAVAGVDAEKAAAAGVPRRRWPRSCAWPERRGCRAAARSRRARGCADRDAPAARDAGGRAYQALRLEVAHGRVGRRADTRLESRVEDVSIYHKNLQPVTYVTGDLAGADESPVYAIFRMNEEIAALRLPEGHGVEIFNAVQPTDTSTAAMKWDGEWHITIEVFRDLGIAFAAVLVLIYILVVGWFESFETPLLIMAAIPFSLVGILPAHAMMGAFFTATSMIGFIAGAGIVVRNSIILVDFIELRLKEGMPLELAVIDAGAVRFRPMALTAAAVIVGAGVILFDPIFQGLAISLMAGEIASLALSRMAVPVLYYMANKRRRASALEPAIA
jgi:multidrug efflux pump subunit AcrB